MKLIRKTLSVLTAVFLLTLGCSDSESPVAPIAEDRTPPDIRWAAIKARVTLQDMVRIQLAYLDKEGVDSIHLVQNGAIVDTFQPDGTEGTFDYLWNTRSDSDGVHIWEARAWDDFGNMGSSLSLLVHVRDNSDSPPEDHTPPQIVWLSPTPGDTLSGLVHLRFQVIDESPVDSVLVTLSYNIHN